MASKKSNWGSKPSNPAITEEFASEITKITDETFYGTPVLSVPFVRNPYNYDTMAASDETGLFCEDPSMAQQNYREECDINNIMDRFVRTGTFPETGRTPTYGDFNGYGDYHSCVNRVIAAQEEFMDLPARVREKFDNDPGKLLGFLSDPSNRDEAIELGLVAGELSPGAPERAQHAGGGAPGGNSAPAASTPPSGSAAP